MYLITKDMLEEILKQEPIDDKIINDYIKALPEADPPVILVGHQFEIKSVDKPDYYVRTKYFKYAQRAKIFINIEGDYK